MNAVGLDFLGIAKAAPQTNKTQPPTGQPQQRFAVPQVAQPLHPSIPVRAANQPAAPRAIHKAPSHGLDAAQVAAKAKNVAARAISSGNKLAAHAPSRATKKFMSTNAQRSQTRRSKSGQKLANLGRQLQKIASSIPTTGVHGQDNYAYDSNAPQDDNPSGGGTSGGGADWISAWLEKFIPAVNTLTDCMSAVASAGEIATQVGALADQLSAAGQTTLANQGYSIANAAQDVIYNAQDFGKITTIDQVDTSVIGTVQQIQARAQTWQAQAQGALAPAPSAPGGGGGGFGGGGDGGGLPSGDSGDGGFDVQPSDQDDAANAALDQAQAPGGDGQSSPFGSSPVDPSLFDPTQDPSYSPLDDGGGDPAAAWAASTALDQADASDEDVSDITVIDPDGVVGLDHLGAMQTRQTWDEVRSPLQVILSPRGLQSTIYGDPLTSTPSGVARIAVSGGNFWQPQYETDGYAWDDSKGSAPSVVVFFSNGSSRRFAGLQSVSVRGGVLHRGVSYSGRTRAVVGAFDVAKTQHDLDAIKPVTVAQAAVLLKYGQTVISAAIKQAGSLPGDGARQECYWKLKWHEDALSKLVPSDQPYGAGDDLKKWVQQAFIEMNAVKEGASYAEQNWNALVAEIKARAASVVDKAGKLPVDVADKVEKTAGVLKWVAIAGGVVLGVVVLGVGGIYLVRLVRG